MVAAAIITHEKRKNITEWLRTVPEAKLAIQSDPFRRLSTPS